jgi:hypothetical protein
MWMSGSSPRSAGQKRAARARSTGTRCSMRGRCGSAEAVTAGEREQRGEHEQPSEDRASDERRMGQSVRRAALALPEGTAHTKPPQPSIPRSPMGARDGGRGRWVTQIVRSTGPANVVAQRVRVQFGGAAAHSCTPTAAHWPALTRQVKSAPRISLSKCVLASLPVGSAGTVIPPGGMIPKPTKRPVGVLRL